LYATNQVFWLIEKGDDLSQCSEATYSFFRIMDSRNPQGKWTDRIVSSTDGKQWRVLSDVETNLPPFSLESGVDGDTRESEIQWKTSQRNWNSYKKIHYEIRPIISNTSIIIETRVFDNEAEFRTFSIPGRRVTTTGDNVVKEDLPMHAGI
jgi:hypothetical protein